MLRRAATHCAHRCYGRSSPPHLLPAIACLPPAMTSRARSTSRALTTAGAMQTATPSTAATDATKSRKRKAAEAEQPTATAVKAKKLTSAKKAAARSAATSVPDTDELEVAAASKAAKSPAVKAEQPAQKKSTKKASSAASKQTASPRKPSSSSSDAASAAAVWKHGTISREMEETIRATTRKTIIVGVDEAGRGPLAGPVVAAAVYLPAHVHFEGVNDSKKLDEPQREMLYEQLTQHPDVVYAVCVLDHTVVDRINILAATLLAMQTCTDDVVAQLHKKGVAVQHVLVDGNRLPKTMQTGQSYTSEWVIKGDTLVYSIAAASILAKVHRDRIMREYHAQWSQYGFDSHKGYGCASHMAAIHRYGPCPIHRLTFAPMKHMKPRKAGEEVLQETSEVPAKPRTSKNSKRAASTEDTAAVITETAVITEKPTKKAKGRSTKKV